MIEALSGYRVLEVAKIDRLWFIGSGVTLIVVNYFLLVHDEKYLRIAKEFSHETPAQRKTRLIAVLSYVIASFVTFFGFGWVVLLRNS